jgi:hypothetical protein
MKHLIGIITLMLFVCSPALAQTDPNMLSEADMIAAVDSVCACDAGETPEEGAPAEDTVEDGDNPPGKCISRLAKLRQALKTLAFFGAVEEFDVKSFVKDRKKECKGAKKANKGKGKGKGGGEEEGGEEETS